MSVDYRQLEEFQKKLEKMNVKIQEEFIQSCCKELAARLLRKVIKRTPVGKKPTAEVKTVKVKGESGKTRTFLSDDAVRIQQYWGDYHGGTLRRGWTGGKNVKAEEYANNLSVQRIGGKYHIDIINPVEYASYVEYGHRQEPGRYVPAIGKQLKVGWVEGRKMLTISESELRSTSAAILQKKLVNFMKDEFK